MRIHRLIAAAACLSLPLLAGTTQRAGAVPPPKVLVIGDSISGDDAAGPQIDAVFGVLEGWETYRWSQPGKSVGELRDDIRWFVTTIDPDVVVIELGSNDMGGVALRDTPCPEAPAPCTPPSSNEQLIAYAAAVAELEGALYDIRNVPCAVWVNVNDWTNWDLGPSGRYDLATWGPVYNQRLLWEKNGHASNPTVAAHPNLRITPYAAKIRAKGLTWRQTHFDSVPASEGVLQLHPVTTTGKQEVAKIMANSVSSSCGI